MNYIIDGYNLAFNLKSLRSFIETGNTDAAVSGLVNYVKNSLKGKAKRIIIVFDGARKSMDNSRQNGVEIWFSKKPQTADELIQNFIRKSKKLNTWTVVSSDLEIIYTAQDHGTNIIKSGDFITTNSSSVSAQPLKQKQFPGNVDIEYWKELFNSVEDDDNKI